MNTTHQVGGALGLAVLATLSTNRTGTLRHDGVSLASSLTSGFHLAFTVAALLSDRRRSGLCLLTMPSSAATQAQEAVALPEAIELEEAA